jgi:sec-independent protein translocase protein TatA
MINGWMAPLALLGGLGTPELVVIVLVALLLFGHRLPDVARSAGRAVVEFKKGLRDVDSEVKKDEAVKKDETKDLEKKA